MVRSENRILVMVRTGHWTAADFLFPRVMSHKSKEVNFLKVYFSGTLTNEAGLLIMRGLICTK